SRIRVRGRALLPMSLLRATHGGSDDRLPVGGRRKRRVGLAREPFATALASRARFDRLLARERRGRLRDDDLDAVDGAGRNAQLAADARLVDHRVHALRRADDGVERTGVDAARAADAALRVDARD